MPGTLYQLGSFAFTLPEGVPDLLNRISPYVWVQQDRLGRKPAQQWLGPDADRITLAGLMLPGMISGRQQMVDALRALAKTGKPQMLTSGSGYVFGLYCIKTLDESKMVFVDNGDARRITFAVDLIEYGPDGAAAAAAGPLGGNIGGLLSPTSALTGTAPWTGAASAWAAGAWANSPLSAGTVEAALGSGLGVGQLGAIGQTLSAAGVDPLASAAPVLGAFGIAAPPALSTPQAGTWQQLGMSATGMLTQLAQQHAGPVMTVGLEALRAASTGDLTSLAGANAGGLAALRQNAGTLSGVLNVDPQTTEQIRSLLVLD